MNDDDPQWADLADKYAEFGFVMRSRRDNNKLTIDMERLDAPGHLWFVCPPGGEDNFYKQLRQVWLMIEAAVVSERRKLGH